MSIRNGLLLAALSACLLAACETAPLAPPPAPEPPPPVVEAPPPPPPPEPTPVPVKPKPKPAKKAKKAEPPKSVEPPPVEETVAVAAAPARPIPKGPAWLSRCSATRYEGGVILCDADSLLAHPSASVRIFTRERALAGTVADGGAITYREGLPRRYRLFVVP